MKIFSQCSPFALHSSPTSLVAQMNPSSQLIVEGNKWKPTVKYIASSSVHTGRKTIYLTVHFHSISRWESINFILFFQRNACPYLVFVSSELIYNFRIFLF